MFLFYVVWGLDLVLVSAARKDLYLMGLLPMTGDGWIGGAACLPAFEMALRHVNARADILPDYKLNFIWKDTSEIDFVDTIHILGTFWTPHAMCAFCVHKCNGGKATNAMYELLYAKPTKHMIIGPPCSVEAEVTAQASPFWNISHLGYGGASPLLSDRGRFPRWFRLVSPDTRYNLVRVALARAFGWKRLATINPALDYFSAITDNLVQSVQGTDIEIISEEIFDHDPLTRLQSLKRKDARIILTASYEHHARRVVCAAYKVGHYGPKIVWMFPGWFTEKWWRDPNNEVTCTEDQMAKVVEGSFLTGFFYYNNNEDERGIANISVTEWYNLFVQEENYQPDKKGFEILSGNSYDAVWGAALTLNCTGETLKRMGSNKSLEDYAYDREIGDIMLACLSNQSFTGISGNVKFTLTGDPIKKIRVDQVQDGKKVLVAIYRTDTEEPYIEWKNGGIRWKDGVAPRDSTLITYVEVIIPSHLYVTMSCLAGFGILLAVSFFLFNVIHRNNVFVKLSSPNINNILLLGCIFTYSYVFMVSLERENVVLCKLRAFTLTVGFSMAFGALFSKTWRVYRIFCNKKLLRIRIKDSQLIGTVLVMVSVLCFVLIVWEIIDPLFIVIQFLKEVIVTGNDAEQHLFIRVCTSHYHNYFSWAIYITEGLLLAFGAFLAFETRKVKIEALNDSRLIGTCLYNVVVLSAVGLTLNLALQDQVALVYGIMSAVLIIGTTATQLIVFIPKIMAVFYPHSISNSTESTGDGVQSIALTINSKINSRYQNSLTTRDTKNGTTMDTSVRQTSSVND